MIYKTNVRSKRARVSVSVCDIFARVPRITCARGRGKNHQQRISLWQIHLPVKELTRGDAGRLARGAVQRIVIKTIERSSSIKPGGGEREVARTISLPNAITSRHLNPGCRPVAVGPYRKRARGEGAKSGGNIDEQIAVARFFDLPAKPSTRGFTSPGTPR